MGFSAHLQKVIRSRASVVNAAAFDARELTDFPRPFQKYPSVSRLLSATTGGASAIRPPHGIFLAGIDRGSQKFNLFVLAHTGRHFRLAIANIDGREIGHRIDGRALRASKFVQRKVSGHGEEKRSADSIGLIAFSLKSLR